MTPISRPLQSSRDGVHGDGPPAKRVLSLRERELVFYGSAAQQIHRTRAARGRIANRSGGRRDAPASRLFITPGRASERAAARIWLGRSLALPSNAPTSGEGERAARASGSDGASPSQATRQHPGRASLRASPTRIWLGRSLAPLRLPSVSHLVLFITKGDQHHA